MKPFFLTSFLSLALPSMMALAAGLELPKWEGSESSGYTLGGGLWPAGAVGGSGEIEMATTTGDDGGATGDPVDVSPGAPPPILRNSGGARDLIAVSRPSGAGGNSPEVVSLKPVVGLRVPSPMLMPLRIEEVYAHELPPVEGGLRQSYFGNRPETHLVDPQHLLTEQKSHDVQRFLEYHADEAEFDICLILFGGTQEIPEGITLQQVHDQWFGAEPVVTVAYFLEHPERSQVVYGQTVRERLASAVFEQIYHSCVREAQVAETAYDQVERFAIELSIRLYWLAKLIERQAAGETIASTHEELSRPEWQEMAVPGQASATGESGASRADMVGAKLRALPWLGLGLGAAFLSGLLGSGWWWWRRDSLAAKPVLFPDLEMPSRLGGTYSGGGYVGISFELSSGQDV